MFRIFKNGGTLIKIDFKDDPDYIYGELESALMTADFIVLDGYFKSKGNMLASVFFLEKYKDFIEEWKVTPAAGLLIKTSGRAKKLKKTCPIIHIRNSNHFMTKIII